MSRTGEPAKASSPCTFSFKPQLPRTFTTDAPIGLGLDGESREKTPTSGIWSMIRPNFILRGWIAGATCCSGLSWLKWKRTIKCVKPTISSRASLVLRRDFYVVERLVPPLPVVRLRRFRVDHSYGPEVDDLRHGHLPSHSPSGRGSFSGASRDDCPSSP